MLILIYIPPILTLSYRDGSIYFSDQSQGQGHLGTDAGSPQSDTTKDDLSDDAMPIQTKIEPPDVTVQPSSSIYTDLQKAMPSGHLMSNMLPNTGPPGGPGGVMSHTNGTNADVGTMLQEYQNL